MNPFFQNLFWVMMFCHTSRNPNRTWTQFQKARFLKAPKDLFTVVPYKESLFLETMPTQASKTPWWRETQRRKGFIWLTVRGDTSWLQGGHSSRSVRQLVTPHLVKGRENECSHAACLPLLLLAFFTLTQLRLAHEREHLIFWMGLPISVNNQETPPPQTSPQANLV